MDPPSRNWRGLYYSPSQPQGDRTLQPLDGIIKTLLASEFWYLYEVREGYIEFRQSWSDNYRWVFAIGDTRR